MYDYHTNLVWAIDSMLLAVSAVSAVVIVVYSALGKIISLRRARKLTAIRANLQNLVPTGKGTIENSCPIVTKTFTNEQFFYVAKQMESVLSGEFGQRLKICLASSGKIKDIENVAIRSRDKWKRIEAIISLGYADSPLALDILKKSVLDRDPDISYFSILALGQIRSSPSAKILLDFLAGHIDSSNRIATLLEKFPSSVAEEVIRLTESQNELVRFWAIKILSKFKQVQYVEKIESLAVDQSADVRAASCECLGEMGLGRSKDVILPRLKDEAWFVRMHAVRALSRILGPESISEIAGMIKDDSWLVRDSVKSAMIENINESIPYIERLADGGELKVLKDCAEVLEDSNYLDIILKDISSVDTDAKKRAVKLLNAVVKSGAHLGLEAILAGMEENLRKDVLGLISDMDKVL
ncbi:MAG: HEAT repeat domain-containing protein, partial [Candidatus Ratteibacteria bacterium]|nr:HEAT repeat domain-containing protein [Candidatus Ratteibacteria bacterium]